MSRAMVVRNSWITQGKEATGFIDAAVFGKVEKGGDAAIKRWIREQLEGTSVTVVLVGSHSCSSTYIEYEIQQSSKARGNGLLGIDVSKIKDLNGRTTERCGEIPNPLGLILSLEQGRWLRLEGLGDWIEEAAIEPGGRGTDSWKDR